MAHVAQPLLEDLYSFPLCEKFRTRPVFWFADAGFDADVEFLADAPFWDGFGRAAVAAFGEDVGFEPTKGFADGLVVVDLKRDNEVGAAGIGHDAATGFEILEGFAFLFGEEGVAVHDDDHGVAEAFGFGDATQVTWMNGIVSTRCADDGTERIA